MTIGALLAVTIVGPVAAQRAVHITGIPIAVSVVDEFLSDACGYEVTFTLTGTGSATLVYNDAGLIIREVSNTILVTYYPEGATIGAPAQAIATGFYGKVPGSIPNAGPDIILAHVTEFTTEGLPLTEVDEFVASPGPRPADFVEALCAALDG